LPMAKNKRTTSLASLSGGIVAKGLAGKAVSAGKALRPSLDQREALDQLVRTKPILQAFMNSCCEMVVSLSVSASAILVM
jgi:hypothetical protein